MEPVKVKLKHPVQWGSETFSELVIGRRPKVSDLRGVDTADGIAAVVRLASKLCAVDEALIGELDLEDFTALSDAIAPFFGSRETGANS